MKLRQNSFGVELDGYLITELPVDAKHTLGIEIKQPPIPGVVSMYEEHDCRISAHYTLREWYNLKEEDRALEIAHYRIRHALDYQKNKRQEEQAERVNQKKGKR